MIGKYRVITLCGSTRFKEEFEKVQRELTLKANIVISVGLFSHAQENGEEWLNNGTKEMLDDLHKRKIDMSDGIFIINKDKYIGKSTMGELYYGIAHNKEIYFLEEPDEKIKSYLKDFNVSYSVYENSILINPADANMKGD